MRTALLAAWCLASGAPASAQDVLLVHLPSAPIEAAAHLAEAMAELAGYLSKEVPDADFEVRLFRRWNDADGFLTASGAGVALVLAEASFLLDRGPGSGLLPTHRLTRSGRGTYRRLVVVRAGAEDVRSLVDLQGRTLSIVETAGRSGPSFLERAVFEGEVAPLAWFGELRAEPDDFEAANKVLYGQSDAALLSEHNPLAAAHLGKDLRAVYTSPPLSLPVLAVRESAFGAGRRAALDRALAALAGDSRGRRVLEELKSDGFEPLRPAEARAVVELPRAPRKELEIALPAAVDLGLELPRPPPAGELPFTIVVEIPDVPLPRADAGRAEDGRD
jgi:ABC-type phosphate/phosphonate transport system substrate-binding protein